ncbi:40-residue YVTN family beta-propeller repeat protein [uncultured Mycobacterium sp.]|uniref:40-residue YVTN family beta-propeller repeat protein n=1 Tax=uncultured Mycobacterium sp. TaxID=171292 RepID=A0A1Y5PF98_9MYCO|nr:40-residue YVTN family beta-propeller repeat protein [uncultured Mycobacterium sp.]
MSQWLRVGAVGFGLGAAVTVGQGTAAAAPDDSAHSSAHANRSGQGDHHSEKTSRPTGTGHPVRLSSPIAPAPTALLEAASQSNSAATVPVRAATKPTRITFGNVVGDALATLSGAVREVELSVDRRATLTPSASIPLGLGRSRRTAVEHLAVNNAASATLSEGEQEAADAKFNLTAGWVPVLGTYYNTLSLATDFLQFASAVGRADIPDIFDEIADMATDVVGMVPIVGGPLAATIYHVREALSTRPERVPSPVGDSFITDEDTVLTNNVLSNDTDVDGDTLSATISTQATHGTVALNANGSFTYTPTANYSGADGFTYTVSDGRGGTGQASVSITITAVNDAPVARADTGYFTTNENTTLSVFANDGLITWDASDSEGDNLTSNLAGQPTNGTVDVNSDGSFVYTPNFGYVGSDSFTYTVSDGQSTSNTATVGITVTATGSTGDNAPHASDDYQDMRENIALSVPAGKGLVDYGSYDQDGDVLSATLVDTTANGQVVVNADGSYTYTPNTDYVGNDSFAFTVSDGTHTSNTATVTITVHDTSEETAPEAYGDSRTVDGDTTLAVAAGDGLLSRNTAHDNEGDALTAALVAGTANGQVTVNADGSYTYTPNSGYLGTDSFTYTVSDGQLTSNSATVAITVQSNAYNTETAIAQGPGGELYVVHGSATYNPADGSTTGTFHIARRNTDGSLTDLVDIGGNSSSMPTGLAVDSDGRFYVADYLAGSVTVYDPNNNYTATTLATISSPAGIAVDSTAGRIYVTTVDYTDPDQPSGQLVILDSTGTQIGHAIDMSNPSTAVAVGPNGAVYVAGLFGGLSVYDHRTLQTTISADDLPGYFYGIAVGSDGTAYLADWEGSDTSGDALDGSVIIVNPARPTTVRQLTGVSQPWGITVSNGHVYATDSTTQRVVTLDPADAIPVIGNTGSGDLNPYSTDVATGIAVGTGGTIYALHGTETYNPADGTTTAALHLASQNADGSFTDLVSLGRQPTGVAVGPDGRIYVTDYLAGSVTAYDPKHSYSATTIASIANAAGIAIDASNGRIYVTTVDFTDPDQPSGRLVILSSSGTQIGQPIDLAGPSAGVAVGPGGKVYVTGFLGGLAVYDNNGVLQTSISADDVPGTFYGIAVGADGTAYIANRGGSADSIEVVNPSNPTNIQQFTGVTAPWGVVVSNGMIYASSSDTQTLVEFDPATGNPVAGVPAAASHATLAAATGATSASPTVQASSASVATAVTASTSTGGYTYSTISLGGTPTNVTLSANGARGFVVVGSQVKIVDVGASAPAITNTVTVGSNPYMVAVNSFGTRAYVTNSGDGTVSIIEKGAAVGGAPTVTTVAVGSDPTGIAVNSNGTRAYVANTGSGTVSIINYGSSTPITVAVGSNPTGVAVNSAGTVAYVTNTGGNTVSIIRYNGTGTPTVTAVTVSARPQSVKTSDNGNKAIVYSSGGYVSIIDASGSATQVPGVHPSFDDYPGFTAMSSDGSTAFVTEHGNGRVTIIDTSNPGATPQYSSVSDYTHSIVSLPDGSEAFTVAHDAFWVVDSKTLQSVPVYIPVDNSGSESERIAISSDGKRVIAVSNNGDLTAFYLSSAISTQSTQDQWWRTTPSKTPSTASKDATGAVTGLLAKITKKDDRISIDKIVGSDGYTKLVVYISGVGGNLASQTAFLDLKAGFNDPAVSKAIDRVVELNGKVNEIMLVGFSKGGSAAQVYAASGKYGGKNGLVTTVVTFASPLVKKATDYPANIDVLNLEAVDDYIPRDEFVGSMFGFVDWGWHMQASNRDVRQTFDNDKTDWKTIYVVDTEALYPQDGRTLAQIEDQDGHNHDNYYVAAREYEKNAYRWEQSRRVITDIRRFNSGSVTHVIVEESFQAINDPLWGPDLSLV